MNSEALAATLQAGEAYLIFSEENRRYFTGFAATDGWLLVTPGERIFLTDSRYIEAARRQVKGCTDVVLLLSLREQLPALCARLGVKELFIEDDRMNVAELRRLRTMLTGIAVSDGDRASTAINRLRSVKTQTEIAEIEKAQAIAEKAFSYILTVMREGVTEKEVALSLDYFMLKNGAEALSFETIAVSGPNSSMPHGVPSDRKLQKGDFITLDYGAVVNGYHSDMTRTVALGRVTDKMAAVYDTVLSAQKAALDAIGPGVRCFDADKAARDIITAAGYGDCFGHSTGHGVGVEIHEAPSLSPKSGDAVLEIGNVVTAEPGIYLPGEFGVRIEDMAAVTAFGCRNLTGCPKDLIVI